MQQKHDWPALVEAQARSGLTQKAFCAQHGLHPVTFSLKRSQVLGGGRHGDAKAKPPGAFVRAQPCGPGSARSHLELSLGTLRLRFAPDTAPGYVAALVRALS